MYLSLSILPWPCHSATGAYGPLCGAVVVGEYYWSTLHASLEACHEQTSGDQLLAVVLLVVMTAVVAVATYVFKNVLHTRLSALGKCYTTPAGIIGSAIANGRFKVLWTTLQILVSIPWNTDIGEL